MIYFHITWTKKKNPNYIFISYKELTIFLPCKTGIQVPRVELQNARYISFKNVTGILVVMLITHSVSYLCLFL